MERVRRADDASSFRILQDVCVDHGGLHILVAEVRCERIDTVLDALRQANASEVFLVSEQKTVAAGG